MRFKGRIFAVGVVTLFNVMRYFYYHVYFELPFEQSFFILTVVFISIAWWCGKQYDRANFYSEKDSLTNTYNRRTIEKIFPKLTASLNEKIAVMMIDLDDFKNVNDNFGHQKGDEVLKAVATLLQNVGGKDSLVARWGGDEFVILIPYQKGHSVYTIIEELQTEKVGNTISVRMSVGHAVYPDDGKTLEALIQKADQAMYKEKKLNDKNILVLGKL